MSFDSITREAGEAIVDAFSNVDVLVDGYESIRGIFSRPGGISEIDSGGEVDSEHASLIVNPSQGGHLTRRTALTLGLESGEQLSYFVLQPQTDNVGQLKILLGKANEDQQSASVIRY